MISRKKFVLWSALVLAASGLSKYWIPKKNKPKNAGKFLTQDGKLVEVDLEKIKSSLDKIYTSELQHWIKK